jgi:hypothetical protein
VDHRAHGPGDGDRLLQIASSLFLYVSGGAGISGDLNLIA